MQIRTKQSFQFFQLLLTIMSNFIHILILFPESWSFLFINFESIDSWDINSSWRIWVKIGISLKSDHIVFSNYLLVIKYVGMNIQSMLHQRLYIFSLEYTHLRILDNIPIIHISNITQKCLNLSCPYLNKQICYLDSRRSQLFRHTNWQYCLSFT